MSMTGSDQEPVDLLDAFFGCVRDCPGVLAVETVDGKHVYEERASLAYQMSTGITELLGVCPKEWKIREARLRLRRMARR